MIFSYEQLFKNNIYIGFQSFNIYNIPTKGKMYTHTLEFRTSYQFHSQWQNDSNSKDVYES